MTRTIRLILGDQLNPDHLWFETADDQVLYLMMETREEAQYTTHHILKMAGFFLAMRDFAHVIRAKGHQLVYIKLDDPENSQSMEANLLRIFSTENFSLFEYQEPDEYRLDELINSIALKTSVKFRMVSSQHFLTERQELSTFFGSRKSWRMETFYRTIRQKSNLLMENDLPLGGQWNYDSENRESVPAQLELPESFDFSHDASEVVGMLDRMGVKTMGNLPGHISWLPINREESLKMLKHFCKQLLPFFGRYEDAMVARHATLFHSRLSFSLNTKMLRPLEVVQAAIAEFEARPAEISLPQIEGFVRQIIGWREYMRGVYWARMPEFSQLNFFNHQAPLPSWFWTGETKMKCMRTCIQQSLDTGYAHHIQRLMVTGNFALLFGAHPDEVDQWYLGIYVDAVEWVQITNTRGMSQYADGGFTASKPYVSSARYIHKMSDYCTGCHYNQALKTGARSCPFNSLYWDFHHRHQSLLQKNPRIGMTYRTWEKMKPDDKSSLLERANWIRSHSEEL